MPVRPCTPRDPLAAVSGEPPRCPRPRSSAARWPGGAGRCTRAGPLVRDDQQRGAGQCRARHLTATARPQRGRVLADGDEVDANGREEAYRRQQHVVDGDARVDDAEPERPTPPSRDERLARLPASGLPRRTAARRGAPWPSKSSWGARPRDARTCPGDTRAPAATICRGTRTAGFIAAARTRAIASTASAADVPTTRAERGPRGNDQPGHDETGQDDT